MTRDGLLTLTQWLSPAFPISGYAYSHGLEAAIAGGQVSDAGALKEWLGEVISQGSGRVDAVLLVQAMAEGADHGALGLTARALAASRERWEETSQQGAAFTETVNAVEGRDDVAVALPVAVGRAARGLGCAVEDVAALYLQAFAGNLVSVAVRFMPLGQTEGQRVLTRLRPVILEVAREACGLSLDQVTSAVPAADLAAMAHEEMDVRIFRT
ncbi:MAG: urease accessory UreF family protein [Pseudomonadota bacterium]